MINESVISGFESKEDFEKFVNILTDIASKDETFIFDANSELMQVYLKSEDKNLLHKKSLWLISKTDVQGLKYSVKSKTGSLLREVAFDKLR